MGEPQWGCRPDLDTTSWRRPRDTGPRTDGVPCVGRSPRARIVGYLTALYTTVAAEWTEAPSNTRGSWNTVRPGAIRASRVSGHCQ
jgi:hypothetical protein